MKSVTTAVRSLLERGRSPAHAIVHRARTSIRSLSKRRAVPVQITLDGHDLLNWRSPDTGVHALLLGGQHLAIPALDAPGPPHGVLRLDQVLPGSLQIRASTRRGVRPVTLLPAGDGTRNEARSRESGTWFLECEPAPRLVHRAAKDEKPGVVALEAAHGIVTLGVGQVSQSWALTLERRGGGCAFPVASQPGSATDTRIYRFGGPQWRETGLPVTGETTVWDVVARHDEAPGTRVRLKWRGSGLESPRRALRLRAVFSYAVPGRRIEIRPYWTKDDYLALELTSTPSLGGEAV